MFQVNFLLQLFFNIKPQKNNIHIQLHNRLFDAIANIFNDSKFVIQ